MTDRIRRALRRDVATTPPAPPHVYEPTARLVYSDLGLPELFTYAAVRGGMAATLVHIEDLVAELTAFLQQQGVASVAITPSPLLRKIRLADGLAETGLIAVPEAGPTTALITGCDAAVGETGTIVFRGPVPPGWHAAAARVVVLEPKILVPDLIDLLARQPGEMTMISGPAMVQAFMLH
jgi:hypothetical protein